MAVKDSLRPFLSAVKLGWAIESNWTSPVLFALYSAIKPLSSCLILFVMYMFVTGGKSSQELFAFMFVGNAFFMLIMGSLQGLAMVLHVEREHYQTLRYVYLAMSNLHLYLFGRALARIGTTAVAVVIMLLFGKVVFHLPIYLSQVNVPLLLASLFVGMIAIISFGLILAGFSMKMAMHNFFFAEAAGSLFYFLSGVLYPLSVLPPFLQKISLLLPFTYWMEIVRRAVIPSIPADPVLGVLPVYTVLAIMTGASLVLLAASLLIFSLLERETRQKGTIDMTTAY
jgi:ABC-2 type transport system permease protein